MTLSEEVMLLLEVEGYEGWRDKLQHHTNPLHIYTKLRKIGVSKQHAMTIAKHAEKFMKPILYSQPMTV
jgi:hypothetical protein